MIRLALTLTLALVACAKPAPAPSAAQGWSVFKGGKLVLWMDDKPGMLSSRAAPPPPGAPLPMHPFLTATSKDVMAESDLRALLDQSKSFADFTAKLKASGYEVKPAKDDD